MSKDCQCNCESKSSSSSFFFGILIGAIVGALIAIVIYKNNKTKVFSDLQKKIQDLVKSFSSPKKRNASSGDIVKTKTIKKPKTFIKPKK